MMSSNLFQSFSTVRPKPIKFEIGVTADADHPVQHAGGDIDVDAVAADYHSTAAASASSGESMRNASLRAAQHGLS